ncbi:MAG: hypothetical protein INR62_07675 [Rhodospirillales bacterium]|nr:hypothetical protein [Acetobacter sp.]
MSTLPRVLAVGVVAACTVLTAACGQSQVNTGIPPTATPSSTQVVDADSVVDTSNLTNLAAISTNIFTGRVESALGAKALGQLPETQFSVTPAVSLKGNVPQTVTLNQQGGNKDGVYISVNGDRPLQIGQWYLFYTRFLESEKWYTVVAADGHTKVTESQARDLASAPLAATVSALRANPQNRFAAPPASTTPSLTFPPPPAPGKELPPPPSTPQPR